MIEVVLSKEMIQYLLDRATEENKELVNKMQINEVKVISLVKQLKSFEEQSITAVEYIEKQKEVLQEKYDNLTKKHKELEDKYTLATTIKKIGKEKIKPGRKKVG